MGNIRPRAQFKKKNRCDTWNDSGDIRLILKASALKRTATFIENMHKKLLVIVIINRKYNGLE